MREPTRPTVYFVCWYEARVVKVGYSDQSRWRVFRPRGGEVVALKSFERVRDALDFEGACHAALQTCCRPAFRSKQDAIDSRLLGAGGGGWMECFRMPGDLTDLEMLEYCDMALEGIAERRD